MESKRLTPKNLEPMIGRAKRVYVVRGRKRPLTLKMIWALHRKLGISAECLIRPLKRARAT
jgi:HTH-type transcriptional regulator/antitoxin HigA